MSALLIFGLVRAGHYAGSRILAVRVADHLCLMLIKSPMAGSIEALCARLGIVSCRDSGEMGDFVPLAHCRPPARYRAENQERTAAPRWNRTKFFEE